MLFMSQKPNMSFIIGFLYNIVPNKCKKIILIPFYNSNSECSVYLKVTEIETVKENVTNCHTYSREHFHIK